MKNSGKFLFWKNSNGSNGSKWFEWFGPSPIEPFNSARRRVGAGRLDLGPAAVRQERHGAPELRLKDLQNLQNYKPLCLLLTTTEK